MILIDTDVLIELLDKESEFGEMARERMIKSGEEVCTSAINLHELLYGYANYAENVEREPIIKVLDYTKIDALLSAKLEAAAKETDSHEIRADSMIAAVAINNNCRLFTNNFKDFNRFTGVKFF